MELIKSLSNMAMSSIFLLSSLSTQAANPATQHEINRAIGVPDNVYKTCNPELGEEASCPILLTIKEYPHTIKESLEEMDSACAEAAEKELEISHTEAVHNWGVLTTTKSEYENMSVYSFGSTALGLRTSRQETYMTLQTAPLYIESGIQQSTIADRLKDKYDYDAFFIDRIEIPDRIQNKNTYDPDNCEVITAFEGAPTRYEAPCDVPRQLICTLKKTRKDKTLDSIIYKP